MNLTKPTAVKGPEYYATVQDQLGKNVKNFDDPLQFEAAEACARSNQTLNFLLDYGPSQAWFINDIPEDAFTTLVQQAPPQSNSRWIQIWYPHLQRSVIKTLAAKYDFSPRLTALMQDTPLNRRQRTPTKQNQSRWHDFVHHSTQKSSVRTSVDTEMGTVSENQAAARDVGELLRNLGHYDIVNSIWHWSSIDVGSKYICLGYNALQKIIADSTPTEHDLPNGIRIWNWLILCDDDTVIAITESPLERPIVYENVSEIRRNLLNVLEQSSKATKGLEERKAISIVPVRLYLSNESINANDAAGLLFYYLFDDWYSTYPLLAKSGHQYGAELNRIRESMMQQANLRHVNQLYTIGRQLAVLKRLYQSYELLIDKILEQQKDKEITAAKSGNDDDASLRLTKSVTREKLRVYLTPDACIRFERLRDRIRLYVLTEIQECIDTKDSLLGMNFNLITIKESDAVERLTRITILLAKVTILFLPVSLMTAYFSVGIAGVEYTVTQFWVSFTVILILSFFVLLIFGKISGTTEGNMVYRPINRVIMDIFRAFLGRHRRHPD